MINPISGTRQPFANETTPSGAGARIRRQEPTVGEPIPAEPPAEVLESLDQAARVLAELAEKDFRLRFAINDETKQVDIDVTDREGRVVKRIPATRAVDVLVSGSMRGLLVDERG